MSQPIISVEHLSKRYLLGHHAVQERYVALRDVIARQGREFMRKTIDMMRGRPIIQGDEIEEFWALRDISFKVEEGEVLGVIGRNGAGKSTLLKVLSRITEPSEGRVVLRGRVASLLEVGTGFHPELTGRENIFLNGAILGMTRGEIKRKFDEIVDFAGVERFLDTPVKRYSSGMYVRLAFAVAAHLEPEILVVDEVLAVGDAEFQKKCLNKMQDVSKNSGRTVLFVSHSMAAIRALCTKAVLLKNGRVVDWGPVDQAIDGYMQSPVEGVLDPIIYGDKGRGEDCKVTMVDSTRDLRINCGEPLAVVMEFEAPEKYARVCLSLVIKRLDESPVVGMGSHVQACPLPPGESKRWRLKTDLGRIPLNAGLYYLDVYVHAGEQLIARFSKAIHLEVVEGDVFGWGKSLPPQRSWGSFYWAPEWEAQAVVEEEAVEPLTS